MTFASPELLLGLLLVPVGLAGYVLVQRRRSRYAVRFTNVDLLANLVPRRAGWRRHVPAALYLAAIAALAFALARPSMVMAVPRDEATVILAMDVSASMRSTDVAPSRLAAATRAASDFVDQLPSRFRVGVVAFSTEARIVLPPTTDRGAVLQALDGLRANGGTALGDAIALSLDAAGVGAAQQGRTALAAPSASAGPSATPAPQGADTPSAPGTAEAPLVATVVLSDGSNSTGTLEPQEAAAKAAAAGVPVYTIALGTADGTVDLTDQYGNPHTVTVPPDPQTLTSVAEATGGRFFAAPTATDLAQIYQNLGSKMGTTQQVQEVTKLFAAAGLILVVVGAAMAAFWFNRFP